MKANEIKLNRFLSQSDTQFIIPVYQRNYDWTLHQCKQLLDDIKLVGANDNQSAHFIGSIVYIHDDIYRASGTTELSIIDGQQRLTTITLIYVALYRHAKRTKNKSLEDRIHEMYLINKHSQEQEKLKLRPTENNDIALKYLLRGEDPVEYHGYSRIIDNYEFFKSNINEDNVDVILKGLDKLMFVEISLDKERDDPQRIFESLNSTGLELSQADLIRNYILMTLDRKKQNEVYINYWQVIEEKAKDNTTNANQVSNFIRDFLTIENKKIPKKSSVYHEFKIKYPTGSFDLLEQNLNKLKRYVKHYNKLINPEFEIDKELRRELNYIKTLEVNVSYPFLMRVYEDYDVSKINKSTLLNVLDLIQSFAWRRFVVGLPTNALNKIFMNLYSDINHDDYLKSLELALLKKRGSQRFPNDTEIINILREKDMYNIKPKNKIYFFERLENFNNIEYVEISNNNKITIEHIFPQKPDGDWKKNLSSEDYKKMEENYLNTIANLTLSGNNGNLGNKSFKEKKYMNKSGGEQGYNYSRLWLNRKLREYDEWNVVNLKDRFKVLSQRILSIWSYPQLPTILDKDDEINIFDVEDASKKKIDYAILFDQKIPLQTISELYIQVLKSLLDLQPESFFSTDLSTKLQITKNPEILRRGVSLNDYYFIETHLSNDNKISRMKLALEFFGLDDELYIKWQE